MALVPPPVAFMSGSRVSLAVVVKAPPLTRYRAKPDCQIGEPDCQIGQMSGWDVVPRWGTIGHMVPLRVQKMDVLSVSKRCRK